MKISKWVPVAAIAAAIQAQTLVSGSGTRITRGTETGDSLVLTFDGPGTEVLGTASLADPDWRPVEGSAISGDTATVPMGAQRFVAVAGDGAPAENSVGFVRRTVPAGKLQIVSVPFDGFEDGATRFGEMTVASQLQVNSAVLFWDAGGQAWSGGSKSGKGWGSAQANRMLAPGEAFFVKNAGGGDVDVTAVGLSPTNATRSLAYAGGGAWTPLAHPYPVETAFGDTELASQLPQGSTVLFWNVERQGWSGASKSSKGWPAAAADHVLRTGEGFFVRSSDAGAWEAARPYDSAVPPASGGGQP